MRKSSAAHQHYPRLALTSDGSAEICRGSHEIDSPAKPALPGIHSFLRAGTPEPAAMGGIVAIPRVGGFRVIPKSSARSTGLRNAARLISPRTAAFAREPVRRGGLAFNPARLALAVGSYRVRRRLVCC